MRWDEGEMGWSGGGHTVRWEVPSCAAAIKPRCVTLWRVGWRWGGMGWGGMGRGEARWQGKGMEGGKGREGEGWVRDG